jgi:hypothetical protein
MSPRPQYCEYIFEFVLQGPSGREDDAVSGWGECVPSTPSHPKAEGQLHRAH